MLNHDCNLVVTFFFLFSTLYKSAYFFSQDFNLENSVDYIFIHTISLHLLCVYMCVCKYAYHIHTYVKILCTQVQNKRLYAKKRLNQKVQLSSWKIKMPEKKKKMSQDEGE